MIIVIIILSHAHSLNGNKSLCYDVHIDERREEHAKTIIDPVIYCYTHSAWSLFEFFS